MVEARLKLSALWVALMLTYLLGDVLRIFSGDFQAGAVAGMEISLGSGPNRKAWQPRRR
jgi:hypothetical protein